jgi:hypothetical protein
MIAYRQAGRRLDENLITSAAFFADRVQEILCAMGVIKGAAVWARPRRSRPDW